MTPQENSTLRRRFASARPGRELITIIEAALPVSTVHVDVLGQERKDIPLAEEFVIRLLDAGIEEVDDMAGFLGLDRDQVETAVAEQYSAGNILFKGTPRRLALTPRGSAAVLDAKAIQPVDVSLPLTFDRLTWQATDYPLNQLLDRREAEEEGLVMLPAQQSARPSVADIPVARLNELLKVRAEESRVEVLAVRKVRLKRPKYLPIKLLVFADAARDDIDIAVCIDGDLAPAHDDAIAQRGGAAALGISVSPDEVEPAIDDNVIQILETHQLAAQIAAAPVGDLQQVDEREQVAPEQVESPRPAIDRPTMYEHADILDEALRTTQRRLLILSPWIQGSVVNTNFLSLLEGRLRAKVRVHIAYGYSGPKGQSDDENAIRRLHNLEKRFPEQLSVVRLRNTHAKILISDDTLVTTSFNWLSFKGSRTREFRVELGLRVRDQAVADEAYADYLQLIVDQSADDH